MHKEWTRKLAVTLMTVVLATGNIPAAALPVYAMDAETEQAIMETSEESAVETEKKERA